MTQRSQGRIARNTVALYLRMLVSMGVALYTSRVLLAALGVEDFGIFNVVGGFVSMLGLVSASMSSATQRFLTFELGKAGDRDVQKVFSTSMTVHGIIVLVALLLAESIGVWFLNSRLNIDHSRMTAANWVYQLSLLTFLGSFSMIPFTAAIIAHEKMSAYAYFGIAEVLLRLVAALALPYVPSDGLVLWAASVAFAGISTRLASVAYCVRSFEGCRPGFRFHRSDVRTILSFAGWSFFGTGSFVLMTEGVNVVSNLFFGVTVNAARGVATQASSAVNQFATSFTTAINPQITKAYASNDPGYTFKLVTTGAKFSYFLMLLFALPLLLETKSLLMLWLEAVPDHSVTFLRLTTVISMVSVVSMTLVTLMLATGEIRNYQIAVGGTGMLVLPLSWAAFRFGFPPESSYAIQLAVFFVQLGIRLYMLRRMTGLDVARFSRDVVLPAALVTAISLGPTLAMHAVVEEGIARLLWGTAMAEATAILAIVLVGLRREERQVVQRKVVAAARAMAGRMGGRPTDDDSTTGRRNI